MLWLLSSTLSQYVLVRLFWTFLFLVCLFICLFVWCVHNTPVMWFIQAGYKCYLGYSFFSSLWNVINTICHGSVLNASGCYKPLLFFTAYFYLCAMCISVNIHIHHMYPHLDLSYWKIEKKNISEKRARKTGRRKQKKNAAGISGCSKLQTKIHIQIPTKYQIDYVSMWTQLSTEWIDEKKATREREKRESKLVELYLHLCTLCTLHSGNIRKYSLLVQDGKKLCMLWAQ